MPPSVELFKTYDPTVFKPDWRLCQLLLFILLLCQHCLP